MTSEELVEAYRGLIITEVNRWYYKFPFGVYSFEDLYQTGVIVLLRSQRVYTVREGKGGSASFTTYFVQSLRNAFRDLLKKSYRSLVLTVSEEFFEPMRSEDLFDYAEFNDLVCVVRDRLHDLPKDLFDYLVVNGKTPVRGLADVFGKRQYEVRCALCCVTTEVSCVFRR